MNQEHRSPASSFRFHAAVWAVLIACTLPLLDGCSLFHRERKSPTAVTVTKPVPVVKPVVRPAPDFAWIGAGGKATPLKSLRGQPVVVLIAASPDEGDFRKEVSHIDGLYLDLSERKTVFLAAFSARSGRVASNVPYVLAADGAAVAKAFGVPPGGFGVAVIAPDGNVDLFSNQVQAAQRLLDMINNSYQTQANSRTGLGS